MFGPVTDRIAQMRELVRDRVIAIDAERALNITESYKKNLMVPPEIRRATATYDVCSKMTCRVEDFELIVGNFGTSFLGSAMWPEEGCEWFYQEFDGGALWERDERGVYHREDMGTRLSITEDEKDRLYSIRDFWKGKTVTAYMDSWFRDGFEEWCAIGASSYFLGKPIGDLPSGIIRGIPEDHQRGLRRHPRTGAGRADARPRRPHGRRRREVPVRQVGGAGGDAATVHDPRRRGGLRWQGRDVQRPRCNARRPSSKRWPTALRHIREGPRAHLRGGRCRPPARTSSGAHGRP